MHLGETCSLTITSSFQNKLVTPFPKDVHQVKSLHYVSSEQKQALNVQAALGDPMIKVGSCSHKSVVVI